MYGSQIEGLREVAARTGKTPPALLNQPDLPDALQDYFLAFFALHARRQYTMGSELPIQVTEIERYCDIHGFDDVPFFYRVIAECDLEYFDFANRRRQNEKPVKKK